MNKKITYTVPILSLIAVRLGIIFSLYWLTSGQEVASDTRFHKAVMSDPWGILKGTADISIASYPPLQWLVELPLFQLFSYLSPEFIAFRLTFSAIELGSLVVAIKILNQVKLPRYLALIIILGIVLGPHQLLTSSIFVQEEVIPQFFMLASLYLIIKNKVTPGLILLSFGILAGKIFLVIPLFYLTVFYHFKRGHLLAWAVFLSVFFMSFFWASMTGGNPPLKGFTPDAIYASTYWVFIINSYSEQLSLIKNSSLLLCVLGQVIVLVIFYIKSEKFQKSINPFHLASLPLAVFFVTFYQHLPEYLLILWPILLFSKYSLPKSIFQTTTIMFCWAPNIFFGMKNIGIVNSSKSPARNQILQPLIDWLGIDFNLLHAASISVYSVLYVITVYFMLIEFRKSGLSFTRKLTNNQT